MHRQNSQQQGTHFYVMTLEVPGVMTAMRTGTYTPAPGATRNDAFNELYELITGSSRDLYRANVVFFTMERNEL
ncbi:hypothetical protein ACFRCX_13110 [Streptomyces sp. NPDC056652]|uniref:hypothetical protein n=1 Tax=Streptomyces sp. NPDC056652 TaxID=3345893 RepID=UPI0036B0A7C9